MLILLAASLILVVGFSAGLAENNVLDMPPVSSVPPEVEWEQTYEGPLDSASWVIQTSDDGYALVGTIGGYRVRLIKTDATGNMHWNQTYEASNVRTVVQVQDGGYVLACNGRDGALLVKTDSEGVAEWNQSYPMGSVNSMVLTADEGYMLAGLTGSESSDSIDFWLAKVDKNGQLEWSKAYGGIGDDEALSVIQTGDGGYVAAGYTESFGFGGRPAHYSNIDIRHNFWLVKVDSAGDLQWSSAFGETGTNEATSLVQTSDGGYVIAGVTKPTGLYGYVTWLIKADSLGREVWNKTHGVLETVGPGDVANSLIRTSDGGFAFAGSTLRRPVHDSSSFFWFVKTDEAGELEWNQTFSRTTGLVNTWEAECLVQTRDGGFAILGSGKMGGSRNIGSNYFYLVKTESVLPPPSPFPDPPLPPAPDYVPSLAFPTTTIKSDGSVEPSSSPILRDGNVYSFTGNLNGSLIVEKDGIVVDGAGFALFGNGTIGELYIRISGTGISLAGRSDVTFKNLTIEEYLVGINVSSCSYVTVEGCAVSRNLKGIYASGECAKLRISNNTIQANDLHGIWLSDINGSLISGNKVLDNSHFGGSAAIIVVSGCDNVIVGNLVEAGGGGISLSRSLNNVVVGNTVANNYAAGPTYHVQSEGLYVSAYSEGNIFYLNNFVNNTVVLSDQVGSHNFWDNGTVGNYWSNYLERYPNATEIGGSGVGDTLYVLESVEGTDLRLLSVENTDHYPLLSPVSSAEAEALQLVLEQEWELKQLSSGSNLFVIAAVAIALAFVIFMIAVVLGTRRRGRRSYRRYY